LLTPAILHELIKKDWQNLRLLPDQVKTPELCMYALRRNINAISHIPDNIKLNPDFLRRVAPITEHKSLHKLSSMRMDDVDPFTLYNNRRFFDSVKSRHRANASGFYRFPIGDIGKPQLRPASLIHSFLGGKFKKTSKVRRRKSKL
jgi:hypothetical protein